MKRSDGLYPKQKMALQIVVTAIFAFYMVKFAGVPLTMLIPFSGGRYLNIGWLAIPLMFFVVIGTVNGVNFTDGLDGLASSCYGFGCNILYGCRKLEQKAELSRLPVRWWEHSLDFCCLMYIRQVCLWGIRVPWRWEDCSIRSIYAPDADFHHHCWIYLSGRSIIRYDPGNIF